MIFVFVSYEGHPLINIHVTLITFNYYSIQRLKHVAQRCSFKHDVTTSILRSLPSCCFLATCPSLALRRSQISAHSTTWVIGFVMGGSRCRVFFSWLGFPRCRPGTFPPGEPTCFYKSLAWILTVANKKMYLMYSALKYYNIITSQYKISRDYRYPSGCWKHVPGSWWRPAPQSTPGTMFWSQKGGAAFLLRVDSSFLSSKKECFFFQSWANSHVNMCKHLYYAVSYYSYFLCKTLIYVWINVHFCDYKKQWHTDNVFDADFFEVCQSHARGADECVRVICCMRYYNSRSRILLLWFCK